MSNQDYFIRECKQFIAQTKERIAKQLIAKAKEQKAKQDATV
ncbi:hypothetical protein PS900_02078 [Pseudomonas fluorescens]|uniref:Uncharacterized protein n=1 Tax=Pseudomonas fluorescens TaxID=294 RepID=A0A8H2RIV1_PSEFL|nr:hypothetical protein [Pseudomonas fluorescens]VVO86122.1 hypothetical protein PS900_02078 [Pseudomonas fluorescens]